MRTYDDSCIGTWFRPLDEVSFRRPRERLLDRDLDLDRLLGRFDESWLPALASAERLLERELRCAGWVRPSSVLAGTDCWRRRSDSARRSLRRLRTMKGSWNLCLQLLSVVACGPPQSPHFGEHVWFTSEFLIPHLLHTASSGVGQTSALCPSLPQA
ncbi:hypothetical protein MTO96_033589 [Rhipicephalus appendiculatus]